MRILATAQAPKAPRTKEAKTIARFYAILLGVFVIMQLVSFSKFPQVIMDYWLPGGAQFAYFLSAFIIFAEILAIPFLLCLKLSKLFRAMSMALGWIVAAIWLFISLWLVLTINSVSNVGFLGATISITPGWWAVFVSLGLCIIAAWASWGLWPFKRKK